MSEKHIAIVAGEASGDLHSAALVQEMRRRRPDLDFWGVGGPRMRSAGVDLLYDCAGFSAIGLPEVLRRVPRMTSVLVRMRRELAYRRPDLLIPVDFGVFNLRLAAYAKRLGIPVFGYFPPGSWSRQSRRAAAIARVATRIATPFPWSEQLLRDEGADATFVGHPLLDILAPYQREREAAAREGPPLIAFLPCSRDQEVRDILPMVLDAADLLAAELPDARFGLSLAPTVHESVLRAALAGRSEKITLERDTHRLLARSDVAVVKSGTATLEAAILGVPMVVVYAVSTVSGWYYKRFYRAQVPLVAMPNILAGRQIVPELIQDDMTAERIAAEVLRLIRDDSARETMLGALAEAVTALGTPGGVARTADLALELL